MGAVEDTLVAKRLPLLVRKLIDAAGEEDQLIEKLVAAVEWGDPELVCSIARKIAGLYDRGKGSRLRKL